jgi:hypothetical protein
LGYKFCDYALGVQFVFPKISLGLEERISSASRPTKLGGRLAAGYDLYSDGSCEAHAETPALFEAAQL